MQSTYLASFDILDFIQDDDENDPVQSVMDRNVEFLKKKAKKHHQLKVDFKTLQHNFKKQQDEIEELKLAITKLTQKNELLKEERDWYEDHSKLLRKEVEDLIHLHYK